MNKPNPGSDEAIKQGCKCPRIDNIDMAGVVDENGEPLYWINEDCPLHGELLKEEVEK